MATIKWNTNLPSDASKVGLGAADIRAAKRAIYDGLRESLNFPNEENPVLAGAPRPFYAGISALSTTINAAPHDHGRLFFASDTSELFVLSLGVQGPPVAADTINIQLVGSKNFFEHATAAGTGTRLNDSGVTHVSSASGSYVVPFNVKFDAAPFVYVTSDNTDYSLIAHNILPTQCNVAATPCDGTAASNITIHWLASGISSGPI